MAKKFNDDQQMITNGSNVSADALDQRAADAGKWSVGEVLTSAFIPAAGIFTAMDKKAEQEQLAAVQQAIEQRLGAEPQQFGFLVRGATLRCSMGSHARKLNLPECHGVYITGHPAVQKDDCIVGDTQNITAYGVCSSGLHPGGPKVTLVKEDGKGNVRGCACTPTIVGKWMNCHPTAMVSRNQGAGDASGDPFKRTYTNTLTTDSFLVCLHGGIISPETSGQEEETVEGYDYYKMMEESYGFPPEEAALIKSAYDQFMGNPANQALPAKERAHKFFSNISALTDNYSGEATRWNLVAGTPGTADAIKYFNELGMSQADVQTLKDAINRQHQNPFTGKDFAHEMIQYAIFSNDDSMFHTLAGPMIGDLSALGSYKGDVFSTRMGIDDMNSDLDAHNIYNRFAFNTGMKDDLFKTMTEYNLGVQNGTINRAQEFLAAKGDGDPIAGMEVIKTELDQVDIGAQYIAQGPKAIVQDILVINALVESEAVSVDPDIIEKSINRSTVGSVSQGGATVDETKQAFLEYLQMEANKGQVD